MAGRGPQSFKKRQKEMQRKEKQQEKAAKRSERKDDSPAAPMTDEDYLAEPTMADIMREEMLRGE